MEEREQIEKVRQEIMRFRELLTLLKETQVNGERTYAGLLARVPAEQAAGIKEKDLQWKVAEMMHDDLSDLRKGVSKMRFDLHQLERAFEELYDIIATE